MHFLVDIQGSMTVRKNQLFILFVFIGVLLGLAWSFAPKRKKEEEFVKPLDEKESIHPFASSNTMASFDERIVGVGQAWDDTMWSPISNQKDPNSLYNLWYSNMVKQGMSSDYITPRIFEELYAISNQNEWTKENVGKIIAPSYELEKQRYMDMQKVTALRKISTPLCTQY